MFEKPLLEKRVKMSYMLPLQCPYLYSIDIMKMSTTKNAVIRIKPRIIEATIYHPQGNILLNYNLLSENRTI